MEDSADITTSPDSESHKEKGPFSRIMLNHPPEDIVGNLNELTLRKRTAANLNIHALRPNKNIGILAQES